jgi:hypothetical protein
MAVFEKIGLLLIRTCLDGCSLHLRLIALCYFLDTYRFNYILVSTETIPLLQIITAITIRFHTVRLLKVATRDIDLTFTTLLLPSILYLHHLLLLQLLMLL